MHIQITRLAGGWAVPDDGPGAGAAEHRASWLHVCAGRPRASHPQVRHPLQLARLPGPRAHALPGGPSTQSSSLILAFCPVTGTHGFQEAPTLTLSTPPSSSSSARSHNLSECMTARLIFYQEALRDVVTPCVELHLACSSFQDFVLYCWER